jgi:hypothetical protein
MDAGTKTVLKAGPRRGSMTVGDIRPGKDELWVLFNCRGAGKAEILLEPGIIMPFTCLDGLISPIMNRLDLGRRKTLTVRIQAPESVEWALRVTRRESGSGEPNVRGGDPRSVHRRAPLQS